MSTDLFDLSGKVAIVTGTSRGLGQYMARALARAGADLAITSRKLERLDQFTKEVEGLGVDALPLELDVRDRGSIELCVEQACAHYGRIDILVNNAGCNIRKPAVEVTWDDWNTVLDTNLRGTFFMAQAVARRAMIPQRTGRIINIGSVTCVAGYAGLAHDGASRGGVMQLTMSLADDWGPHPARAARAAERPGRRRGLPRLRRQRLRHRPDPARRRRHLHRRHQGDTG